MTRDEAKVILQSCLAHDAKPGDERMEEALAMVQQDEELAAWFENEMSFDQIVRDKIAEVAPPPGLKERILAAAPATGNTPIPFPAQQRAWWQNPKFISLAACIILVFTFGSLVFDPQSLQADPDIPDFYHDVAQTSKHLPPIESKSDSLDELRAFLSSRGAPSPGPLPEKVDPLEEVGAAAFIWQESPVALVCMHDGHDYQLFVIDLAVFGDDDVPPTHAELHQVEDVALMAWAKEGRLYVLTVVGSVDSLQSLM